jgi:prepilin-type N-terminal cleavage/methylation domain-containing protein
MTKDLRKRGFTLVELAIVLVIIGLMIGAVVKGQAMIEDAKQTRLMNDLQGISSAYFSYYSTYNSYPGDDAITHGWSGVTAGDANALIEGSATNPDGESQEAWQALRYSGLLTGDPVGTGLSSLPNHPYGSKFGLSSRIFTGVGQRNYILADNVPGEVGEMVDFKYDDGEFSTGTIQADQAYTNTTVDIYYAL